MEIVSRLRDATKVKSLAIAFEIAEAAVEAGLEGDNYISPTRAGSLWTVDVRDEEGEIIGYLKR